MWIGGRGVGGGGTGRFMLELAPLRKSEHLVSAQPRLRDLALQYACRLTNPVPRASNNDQIRLLSHSQPSRDFLSKASIRRPIANRAQRLVERNLEMLIERFRLQRSAERTPCRSIVEVVERHMRCRRGVCPDCQPGAVLQEFTVRPTSLAGVVADERRPDGVVLWIAVDGLNRSGDA